MIINRRYFLMSIPSMSVSLKRHVLAIATEGINSFNVSILKEDEESMIKSVLILFPKSDNIVFKEGEFKDIEFFSVNVFNVKLWFRYHDQKYITFSYR